MNETTRNELRAGIVQGAVVAALALALAAPAVMGWGQGRHAAAAVPATSAQPAAKVDFGAAAPPDDVQRVAAWAARNDSVGITFAVVDKQRAHLYVFDAQGRLRGESPVLLGHARGDDNVPGIGQRPIEQVRPEERTTPAGRFEVRYGRNLLDEDVVWVDYDAAVSMHRVRTTEARERRLERLASPTTEDNRISYGCINVPVAFFDEVLWPTFGRQRAHVYVLPEVKPLDAVFPQV
jgi:hypothetical protein